MTRDQAIQMARNSVMKSQDGHKYLPINAEMWMPHEWVIDAILAASEVAPTEVDLPPEARSMSGDPQEPMDDSDRLKPCPFCGGSASAGFIRGDGDNAGGHYISCDQCDASTGLRFSCGEDARPLLMEQWNTRNLNIEGERAREHLRLAIDHIEALNGALEDLASLGATIAICGTKYDDAAARSVLRPNVGGEAHAPRTTL